MTRPGMAAASESAKAPAPRVAPAVQPGRFGGWRRAPQGRLGLRGKRGHIHIRHGNDLDTTRDLSVGQDQGAGAERITHLTQGITGRLSVEFLDHAWFMNRYRSA
jgi:hypothetical protein